jgi:hypothetical protein
LFAPVHEFKRKSQAAFQRGVAATAAYSARSAIAGKNVARKNKVIIKPRSILLKQSSVSVEICHN